MSAQGDSTNRRWMTSEMWFQPLQGDGWVEVGHTAGWLAPANDNDYFAFAAWRREDGSGYTERVLARLNHNEDVNDSFLITRTTTTNVFRPSWNGVTTTTSNVQFWSSRFMQIGGEVATPDGTSSLFEMRGQAINNTGDVVNLPSPQDGFTDSSSLSGSRPANSRWNWRVRP